MNVILDSIAQVAAGEPTIAVIWPDSSVDYGSDIACTDDVSPLFTERSGDDPLVVADFAWRSITSPRDSIPDAPGKGWDIRQLLRSPATAAQMLTWPGLVRAEITDDDRVRSVDVRFVRTAPDAFDVTIVGETDSGPFTLIGALTPNSVILKEILAS